ncbi:uncharacterized protein Z518_05230 [Rhinocladiella mackenziei CBS 650.93]|uniref:Uncharacterized protein n=1 Tax=Rhinocladiella mackenziei CBS 650.93 TaxID=1442369 RepID=A0A0D2FQ87_9EURO|nr:uncharacterized protein Z518_05230 [Rhinocladiella mackenziei CBS 650.93]KIX04362.1 hypothetical protein Z518_05230 [Rhinocladiella mackenziei CBS 650.93]
MFFSSPTSNITPAMTSVAMSRSDSRDSTSSTNTTSYAPTSAYSALLSASPTSAWPTSHALARSDSNTSTTPSQSSQTSSVAMRRDSSNSAWLPSPYRSCMSSFGSEPNSYLSDDDLLCPAEEMKLPIETIPTLAPKKELTTEEQIALLRELQERESASNHQQQQQAAAHYVREAEARRKVVRFASHTDTPSKSRRPSTVKRRQNSVRRGLSHLNGPL